MTHCATASRRPRKSSTARRIGCTSRRSSPIWTGSSAATCPPRCRTWAAKGAEDEAGEEAIVTPPFYEFGQDVQLQSVLRAAITAAYRRPEPECVPLLLGQARMPNLDKIRAMATDLVKKLRGKRTGGAASRA